MDLELRGEKTIRPHHRLTKPLMDNQIENLNWSAPFGYEGMVRIRIPGDGSCFFHALAEAYCEPYIMGKSSNGEPINRKQFIKDLRKDLSIKLGSRTVPEDLDSPTYYDELSRGNLKEFSMSLPEYSLENMQKELDSDLPVSNLYNEFISDQINKDIYLLDMVKRDVYITGKDDDILYKNRKSIVLLYLPGHYELIGLYQKREKNYKTLFSPDHDFILYIRSRIVELTT